MPFDEHIEDRSGGGGDGRHDAERIFQLSEMTVQMISAAFRDSKLCVECGLYTLATVALATSLRHKLKQQGHAAAGAALADFAEMVVAVVDLNINVRQEWSEDDDDTA